MSAERGRPGGDRRCRGGRLVFEGQVESVEEVVEAIERLSRAPVPALRKGRSQDCKERRQHRVQSKVTAKQLGEYYDADTDSFRKVYDSKTVTVTGKLSGKSAKMLYVELATGTKVPMRVYLNSEEQRTQFSDLKDGSTITVKGNIGVLYPQEVDAGGFRKWPTVSSLSTRSRSSRVT